MAQIKEVMSRVLRAIITVNPSILSLFGIVIGMAFGIFARHMQAEPDLIKIIGFPGNLFINMLKSTVMVFVIVTMMRTPMDITAINEAKAMGGITIVYSIITSIMSSLLGVLVTAGFLSIKMGSFECPGSKDVVAVNTKEIGKKNLLDSIINIGQSCFAPNLFGSIVNDNILGVVVAFLIFGFLLMVYRKTEGGKLIKNFLDVFYQVSIDLIGVIIRLTPVGIFSLIAGQMAMIKDFCIFKELLLYLIAYAIACLLQVFAVYPLMFFIVTRSNPFPYYVKFLGAITTAFATASSAAALPVGMQAAIEAGVSPKVVNFVMPLGATMNMDGSSIYYPATLIFISEKYGDGLGPGKMVILAFVSALVTVGGAPVPAGALVYLYTVANAIGLHMDPKIVSLIWAIDPFMDRTLTAINVTGVAYAAKIVEVLTDYYEKRSNNKGEKKESSEKKKSQIRKLERTLSNSMLSHASKLLEDSIRASHKKEASKRKEASKAAGPLKEASKAAEPSKEASKAAEPSKEASKVAEPSKKSSKAEEAAADAKISEEKSKKSQP